MTSPTPFTPTDDYTTLRKRWLNRYIRVQSATDHKIRVALIQAADDASKELISESSKSTFSAGVKSAQLRLSMQIIKEVLDGFFKEETAIIKDGTKKSASAAVTAFTETDRNYLRASFSANGDVNAFIEGQRTSSMLGVANAVNRITRSDQPLSSRVYRSKRLANIWVKNQVNTGLVKNESAQQIAQRVRKSIRPTTAGGVSYAAMRLARTELNNAFHATTVDLAKDRPWVEGMRWNLSSTHNSEIKCVCQTYADQIFTVEQVPSKPHPQCRCFVTPEVEPYDVFLRHLTAGQYRSWISEAA